MGRDEFVASAAYEPEPTAAAAARRFVRDTLQAWVVTATAADGHGLVDDAVLLTSELVTNAVVHAGTPVHITCRLVDGGVEVMVSDGHPSGLVPEPPEKGRVPAERTNGRGLLLPAALASAWGVTYGRTAKAVWFRLRVPAPAAGATGIAQADTALLSPGAVPDGWDSGAGAVRDGDAGSGSPAAVAGAAGPGGGPGADSGTAPAAGRDGPMSGLAVLVSASRRLSALPSGEAHGDAASRHGPARGSLPGAGEAGYDGLLATVVDSARALVSADAAYALMADEDGDLGLRASAGTLALPGGAEPDPPVPGGLAGADGVADDVAGAQRADVALSAGTQREGVRGRPRGRPRRGTHGGMRAVRSTPRAIPGPAGPAPHQQTGPALHAEPGPPGERDLRGTAHPEPSVVTVPFVVDGRVSGLLAAASAAPRRFEDVEAARLQRLADHWGPLLERARTRELERARRGRIGALADARGLLSGSLSPGEAMALAATAAVPRLVPWCAVLLREEERLRTAHTRHADDSLAEALAWLLDRAAGTAAAPVPSPRHPGTHGPAWHWPLTAAADAGAPPGASELARDTAWCYPLGPGAEAGALAVGHPPGRRLPREAAELVADLALRLGMALAAATLAGQKS